MIYVRRYWGAKLHSSSPMRTPSIIISRAAFMLATTEMKNKTVKNMFFHTTYHKALLTKIWVISTTTFS